MRHIVPAISVLLTALVGASPAGARERVVHCKLVVDGKTIFAGRCGYEKLGADGSFTISERKKSRYYFAYLVRDGAGAEGSWNADRMSNHADAHLGAMTQVGGCWQTADQRNRICAWK